KKDLCWLPTWFDAREILDGFDVSAADILSRLQADDAFAKQDERLCLYQMIEEALLRQTAVQTG
ncbi:MAG: hypothetical protein P8J33_11040, partial [Pirellulaceae bacterium]|nr:hypothetical protein [Pirellulaceae bacterium]